MAAESPGELSSPKDPGRPEPEPQGIPLVSRIALHVVGWLVLLVGVAGLLLPGIQGILTILAGAAILSVASDRMHAWLQRLLARWPATRERLNRFRRKLKARLGQRE